jgi:hypothetical protein
MATEGLPPDRVPQELRRQTLSQLEEAIRNYPGTPGATPPSLQNPTDVENNLFDQSRNSVISRSHAGAATLQHAAAS